MPKFHYVGLNTRLLVDRLGGVPNVQSLVESGGFETLPQRNIYKWMERDSIPSRRLAEIMWIIMVRKLPLRLTDFLEEKSRQG